MIQIHEDKCIRCLRCADKCVCGAIEVRDGKPVVNHEKGCIKCMHCAIACPENAISYGEQPAILNEEMPVLADTFSADLENFLLTKRSYRNFKPEPVPMTEIESALNAAGMGAACQEPAPDEVLCGQRAGGDRCDDGADRGISAGERRLPGGIGTDLRTV